MFFLQLELDVVEGLSACRNWIHFHRLMRRLADCLRLMFSVLLVVSCLPSMASSVPVVSIIINGLT
jgi:hypothetical protein